MGIGVVYREKLKLVALNGRPLVLAMIDTLIKEYSFWLKYEQGRAKATIYKYDCEIRRAFRELNIQDPCKLTLEHIQTYKWRLIDEGKGKNSINHLLKSVRYFLLYLREHKGMALAIEPIEIRGYGRRQGLRYPKIDYLTPEQFDAKMALIDITTIAGLRLRTLCEIMRGTGLRIAEALSLNVDTVTGSTFTIVGKGDKEGTVYATDRALQWLKLWLEKKPDKHEALFTCYMGGVKRWTYQGARTAMKILGKEFHSHILRHTFGTDLYDRSGDILLVQKALRHADLKTTVAHYVNTDVSRTLRKFKKAMGE